MRSLHFPLLFALIFEQNSFCLDCFFLSKSRSSTCPTYALHDFIRNLTLEDKVLRSGLRIVSRGSHTPHMFRFHVTYSGSSNQYHVDSSLLFNLTPTPGPVKRSPPKKGYSFQPAYDHPTPSNHSKTSLSLFTWRFFVLARILNPINQPNQTNDPLLKAQQTTQQPQPIH